MPRRRTQDVPSDPFPRRRRPSSRIGAAGRRAAFTFYSGLFGWKRISEVDLGTAGNHLIFGREGEPYGSMMTNRPDVRMAPRWVHYVHVDDLEGAIARATSSGGKVLLGPLDIPDGTRIAQLTDPQRAVFALHGPAK